MSFFASIDPVIYVWLLFTIVFVVIELCTVGLTSIWFAAGALVAMILAICHVPFAIQIIAFLVVSFGALYATKPLVSKYINSKSQKTNADGIVGKEIRISETVNNIDQTGTAVVNGQEWTVRAADDDTVLAVGDMAIVVGIQGVKLIVKKKED